MPIYDFRCRECGKVSEIFLRGANQTARCPAPRKAYAVESKDIYADISSGGL